MPQLLVCCHGAANTAAAGWWCYPHCGGAAMSEFTLRNSKFGVRWINPKMPPITMQWSILMGPCPVRWNDICNKSRNPNHTCLSDGWLQYDGSEQQQKRLILLPTTSCCNNIPTAHSSSILTAESPFMLGLWGNMKQRYPSLSNILNFPFQYSCLGAKKILFCSFCQNWFHRRGDCNNKVTFYAFLSLIRNNIWEVLQIGLFPNCLYFYKGVLQPKIDFLFQK